MVDLELKLIAALAEIDRLDVSGIHTCHSECQKSNCVLRRELITVTEQRDEALEKVATMVLAGDYNDLFIAKVTGNLAARAEITAVTAQRDSLIKAVEPLKYWRDISECDCSCPLPQGGCLRCDLNRILKITNPNEP